MAQGAGLECYIARSSKYDWYGHVANIVRLDGKWYYMEPMGDIVGSPNTFAEGGIADDGSVITYPDGLDIVTDIWKNEILNASIADRAAKAVNASYYSEEDGTPEELWRSCSPFSRESCRAAADFTRAYCRITGITEKDAAHGSWNLTGELLENLSRTEHLRWNAFHRSMGWMAMTDEEFAKRAEIYRFQRMKTGKPLIRIAKNEADRHHACLV